MEFDHPRYTPHETLGEGAQGRVVRVVDRERPDVPLVAKIVRSAAGHDARLAGEFALLARLRVPGLVRVHDFGRDARGVAFLVEDLIDGDDAVTAVERAPSAERPRRLTMLAAELAETLCSLHDAGFVHGDVKPSNVRVPCEGRAMLLDLGASVASRVEAARAEGPTVHTPAFAAPEVRAGARPAVTSDLFGLGATLWACATGTTSRAGDLRDRAPWVPPRLADLIGHLVRSHPADRPQTARDVLAALGRSSTDMSWESGTREEHVREATVRRILTLDAGASGRRVVYVIGPSGVGKSHVVREVATRALLHHGRAARLVRFPEKDATFTRRLVGWLRGGDDLFGDDDVQVFLDDLDAAPAEVTDALESFRCMTGKVSRRVVIVATARRAPHPRAESIEIGPLDGAAFERLCRDEGIAAASELARESGGLPGWLFASLGRVPLTAAAALARLASLPASARELVALVATLGGHVPGEVLADEDGASLAACFESGLFERERDSVRLASPNLAGDLAAALASHAVTDRAAAVAIARPSLPSAALAAVARAACPPERRTELLVEASARARREEARSIEIEMLLALVADPVERAPERLARLERLTRDAGVVRAHPQVVAWLAEAAAKYEALAPLAERRRAEERARAGDMPGARAAAERALELARARSSRADEAYALGTRGAIALWSAEWSLAAEMFARASAIVKAEMQPPADVDAEEIARLDHNLGVVALYRGLADEAASAFERSVIIKRALGDRAGVRSCLLNLGLALTRLGRWDAADAALVEATALADSLGQHAGRGWCLAARADLDVRRGHARDAERLVAEAEALGDIVPKTVRADLVLLRAQIALLFGDARGALANVARIDGELRQEDALVDARAHALEARARLCLLPADRPGAARAAVASLRRARAGELAEAAREAEEVLRIARRKTAPERPERAVMHQTPKDDQSTWDLLRALASEAPDAAIERLARLVLEQTRAERALVAEIDDAGAVLRAWGVDLDGLAIAEPARRIDPESLRAAKSRGGVLYQVAVASPGGTGSRLALAGSRAALVVEHRFKPSAFDHVAEETCARWLTLAEIALRLGARPSSPEPRLPASVASSKLEDPLASSTEVPRREPQREYPEIIGRSTTLRRALAQLDAAVDSDLPVLVEGETGTGKELFARALHEHHQVRRAGPFVAVNCAAIADALFEAELFGHARGAFTGADRGRGGLLARAEGGTLLLDELGELPLARQATLLRVLEERRYRPVGADDDRPFDVRVVAATNRDLDRCVEEGTFRRDLLYRLRVLRVTAPPLRERHGDVELLLRHFLARAGSRVPITPAALDMLEAYPFPGNVRELHHLAQRLAASRFERIDVANLPRSVRAARTTSTSAGRTSGHALALAAAANHTSDVNERGEVESALSRTDGNISRAARLLGLTRHGLKKKMLRLGLRAKQSGA